MNNEESRTSIKAWAGGAVLCFALLILTLLSGCGPEPNHDSNDPDVAPAPAIDEPDGAQAPAVDGQVHAEDAGDTTISAQAAGTVCVGVRVCELLSVVDCPVDEDGDPCDCLKADGCQWTRLGTNPGQCTNNPFRCPEGACPCSTYDDNVFACTAQIGCRVAECRNDAQCGTTEICEHNKCVADPALEPECRSATDCGVARGFGFHCINGNCVKDRPPTPQGACPPDRRVLCSVGVGGLISQRTSRFSDAVTFSESRANEPGLGVFANAVIPSGTASGTKGLSVECVVEASGERVIFRAFDDYVRNTIDNVTSFRIGQIGDSVYVGGERRRWFGHGRTEDTGFPVYFNLFDDFQRRKVGPFDALVVRNRDGTIWHEVCAADGTSRGLCRRWFGEGCVAE